MRRPRPAETGRGRDPIGALPLAIYLLLLVPGCAVDAPSPAPSVLASHDNLYRDDRENPCAAGRLGWNLQGGSGTPVPLPNPGVARNALRLHSVSDRIEGFTTGVLATGGRRFFGPPTAGPVTDNSVDLELLGTKISTSACGEAAFVADLQLAGALVARSYRATAIRCVP